jgi:hypothetical protein
MKFRRIAPVLSMVLAVPSLAVAAGWTKSYAVEWYEPAFYYGAQAGEDNPGSDCPAGTNPENDWRSLLKTSYRSDADIDKILDPENPLRAKVGGIRGPNKENVYEKPWVVPDPHMVGVSGDLAYGFDLDDNGKTGFKGPNGERGIDNQYYRAAGCWMAWRGPARQSHHAKYVNDGMRDGVFTVVMLASGKGKDPANDADVTLAFYLSRDKLVKDANGGIARDYSFRINPDPRFQSVIKARTRNGVLESTERTDVTLHHMETAPFFPQQLLLHKAKVRIETQPDGTAQALLGGYRPIADYYKGWAASGAIHELTTHVNMVGYWYALKNNADYVEDPQSGERTAISTAYRLYLVPAFVTEPQGDAVVQTAKLYQGEIDPSIGRMRLPRSAEAAPAAATSSVPAPSGIH